MSDTHIGNTGGSDYAGRNINHHRGVPASPEEAQALLDQLPTDHVPAHGPPLAPLSRLTLLANPQFVGRERELAQLALQLKPGGTVAITTGMGGVGRTQLASVFAERYGGYFAGGVFWLSFAEPADIPAEVAACGQLMGLPLAGLDQAAQVAQVQAAWQQPVPRLLIFDNCEDQALLRQWLPRLGGCRVLVTCRRQSAWDAALEVRRLPLEVLPRADSVALLQRLAPRLSGEEAGQIAEALGDLPLALHLAGCFLARYRIPAADYLAKLASAPLRHVSLQGQGAERLPNVERAFALSCAQLDVSDPTGDPARRLLARAAYFAPGEPFRRAWLEASIASEDDKEEQGLARTDALERLLSLGLLELVAEGVVRLHRLLAAYVALALSDADALPAVEWAVSRAAKQASETRLPQALLPVLPHLRHLVQQAQGCEDGRVASLCINLGFYLKAVGSYAEALPLYERALPITKRVLGAGHPSTATSLSTLAVLHANHGQLAQALPLLERAVAIRQARLGPAHPDTVLAQRNLATLRREAAIAAAPPALRAALQAQDGDAVAQALQALPSEEAEAVVQQLRAAGVLGDPQEQFMPLLRAITAVAQGHDGPRAKVEAYLASMESQGFHLTAAVQAIWIGERDAARLTAGLDDQESALIHRLLTMISEAEAAR